MLQPNHSTRLGRAGLLLTVGLGFAVAPAIAHAAPVNLATAAPFVVLAGSAVSNSGPSVLNGALGVSAGTALTGFQFATVNGATHDNDGVAAQAKLDLTNAYNVAAAQPSGNLTGQDLGTLSLGPGAYHYSSSAQLTGTLTLNAAGDPNAQFVFQVATALTTASGSRVSLINGASPCNVYWQIGSSATLGTSTAFVGNVMANASISLTSGATVQGRLLARSGGVSLINNVIDASMCGTSSTPPPVTPTPPTSGTGTGTGTAPPASGTTVDTRDGTIVWKRETPHGSSGQPACTAGFKASLRGHRIKSVLFRLDGRVVPGSGKSPFRVSVYAKAGNHKVTARVLFNDATPTKTVTLKYRACASVALRPTYGPSRFTG